MHEDLTTSTSNLSDQKPWMLRLRIEAFMAEYTHAIASDRLEVWPDFFTDSAQYRVCTRENFDRGLPLNVMSCQGIGMFRDRISALRTANVFEPHVYCCMTSGLRIGLVDGPLVHVESAFQVIRTMVDGAMSLFACGRTLDTITFEHEDLKFVERTVILDSRRIDTLLVIPL